MAARAPTMASLRVNLKRTLLYEEDAINALNRIDFIVASLEKAGVPPDELRHFKGVVRWAALAGAAVANDKAVTVSNNGSRSRDVVAEGTLEILQRGEHGFSIVWRSRWVKLLPGRMEVFASNSRPQGNMSCQFFLPLSTQQTRLDTGNEALCMKLGREAILMVSGRTTAGGTLRCVTLAPKDDLALEMWRDFFNKSMSEEGHAAGASIYRACQTGDILRVKEILREGFSPNRPNAYGCIALHYAVKNAALCAEVVARGTHDEDNGANEAKKRAQEALRIVVFLIHHGADARAVNHLGETPLDLASRLTSDLPKSRSLLMSILDPSKYDTTGGTVFVVSGQPRLSNVKEQYGEGETSITSVPTVSSRGVTFSLLRRGENATKKQEAAHSWRPHTIVSITSSFGGGANSVVVRPLRPGDHETALGGVRHRFAASLGRHPRISPGKQNGRFSWCLSSPSNQRAGVSCGDGGGSGGSAGVKARRRQRGLGVMFDNFRMGKRSAVLVDDCKNRSKRNAEAFYLRAQVRPRSTKDVHNNLRRCKRDARAGFGRLVATTTDCVVDASSRGSKHWGERSGEGKRRRRAKSWWKGSKETSPSVPDREARRWIAEWLRQSAGTASASPPAKAYGREEYLVETSPYLATDSRSDVYEALQAIKGDGRGELISSDKLQATLSRVGQALSPSEMDELLREADPGQTGYLSCARLSDLVTSCRLKPLAKGTTYNEEDDVVLQTKANRLAKTKRLVKRTSAMA